MKVKPFQVKVFLVAFISVGVIAIVLGGGCAPNGPVPEPTRKPEVTAPVTPQNIVRPETPISIPLSRVVGDILSSPESFIGKQVEVTGFYRGWNLLKELASAPPVTRSDWVIADESGAIYVTGMAPEKLDPASKNDVWTVVRLVATVEINEIGIYLSVQSVEVIPID